MSRPRPRSVRPARREAACPGCARVVTLSGYLELIPPHTVPAALDHRRNEDGSRRSRAGRRCRWVGDPMPGRPDGHVSRGDAERIAAGQAAETARTADAA